MNRQISAFPDTKGLPPLEEPFAAVHVEERLRSDATPRGLAAPTRLRCSDANACERKLAFSSLGIPKDIKYDAQDLLNFQSGDWYHQIVQEALVEGFDARCEVQIDWSPRVSLSGHCDAVYGGSGRFVGEPKTAVEIKSMKGFGFDLAVGKRKSDDGPGPKVDHLLQAGLYGLAPAIEAERVHMIYINRDQNTIAEWLIGVDEPLRHLAGPTGAPTIRELVDNELARLATVLQQIDDGTLPARLVPGYGLVQDPPQADSRVEPWNCRWCAWQPTCASLAANPLRGWVQEHVEMTQ